MSTTRSYQDRCGVARALDIIGERWSLLIVRELLLGPRRFTELRAGLPRITPAVLSDRLRELEIAGVLEHRAVGPRGRAGRYELTARGCELEPVLVALGRWGSTAPAAPDSDMSVDAHALALRTLFSAPAATGLRLVVTLEIEGDTLSAAVDGGSLRVMRERHPGADATVELDRRTLRDLLWGKGRLREALASGAVRATGDLAGAEVFFGLFPRPRGDRDAEMTASARITPRARARSHSRTGGPRG